jgi:hypothetical protein
MSDTATNLPEPTWSSLTATFEQSFDAGLREEVGRREAAAGLVRTVRARVRADRSGGTLRLAVDEIDSPSPLQRLTVGRDGWEAVMRDGARRTGDGRRTKHGSYGLMFLLDPGPILTHSSVRLRPVGAGQSGRQVAQVSANPVTSLTDADGVDWEFEAPVDPWPFLADDVSYPGAAYYEATIWPEPGIVERWDATRSNGTVLRRLDLIDLAVT